MSFTKTLSSIALAAVIFTVSGASSGFAQEAKSPVVDAKDKILADTKTTTTTTTSSTTSANNKEKCKEKSNIKCKPKSESK